MSHQISATPDEPQVPVANNDWSGIELTQDIVLALADYLDVFVEMDLELKQRKEVDDENKKKSKDSTVTC